MKWIDSTDLRTWAARRDCQETLPLLARKLIRATSNTIKSIKFPSGESVLLGGWDGRLEVIDGTDHLPEGISLWEFGTGADPKGKADDDYKKRTENPLGYNPKESTFVFVTPRLWQNGELWVEEKKKDGIWKEIKVYNSELLEEWIDEAPTVGAWLAMKHGVGRFPSNGIQATDDFWDEWSSGGRFNLVPDILLGGRKAQADRVIELSRKPEIIPVQTISRDEALAFIAACFKNTSLEEDFFSRSIIVDNADTFRELVAINKPLILIPRFEDTGGVINRAIQNGHTVIIPLGADSSGNWNNNIKLPPIERDNFVSALLKTGMTKESAEKFSKESARHIGILRRRLEFTRATPAWATLENASEIIPAIIVGRWDENSEKDKKIVSQIAGESYESYIKKITKWRFTQDPPIVKIGSMWRLTSPLDAWTHVSERLTKNDFELLHKSTIEIFSEIHPALKLEPEQMPFASIHVKEVVFSNWIGEGIIQSLILTSVFGDKLKLDLPSAANTWVDNIIAELLNNTDPLIWKSFQGKLPLIAEASPSSFLTLVDKHIQSDKSPVLGLFEELPGFFTPQSYHTGLLWALECTAWLPEYLGQSSLILAQLSTKDPGGHLSNRPKNSLKEIFKPWHYQTLTLFSDRINVLKLIAAKEPETAWEIFIGMLPEATNDVAFNTHKMRWRMFEHETDKSITYQEIYDTHSAVVDLLISIFDFSEPKFAKLIEESTSLSYSDRSKILSFIESVADKVKHENNLAWEKIRLILSHHRSYPSAEWALKETELSRYQKLYDSLQPSDEVEKSIWLFNDHFPRLLDGYNHQKKSYEEQERIISNLRINVFKEIYSKFGLEKILALCSIVKEPWAFGNTAACVIDSESEIFLLCEQLKNDVDNLKFIQGFIIRKFLIEGIDWVFGLFDKIKARGFQPLALARLLISLSQSKKLSDFVVSAGDEVKKEYWMNVNLHFGGSTIEEKISSIKNLVDYGRYYSAMHMCSLFADEMPIDLIVLILEKVATEETSEKNSIQGYEVGKLFETIDKKGGVEHQQLINLEWYYISILASYGTSRNPKLLHQTLSSDPDFFITVLKFAYKPNNDELLETEKKELSEESVINRGVRAYELFQSWKNIPGVDSAGNVDSNVLNGWTEKVREQASKIHRTDVADMTIGKLLAEYPGNGDNWPHDELCTLIEKINTESIKSSFSSAVFNKYGSSSRGAFDGGDIERNKSEYFSKLSASKKNRFPVVAEIFEKLASWYKDDAKRMDEKAERDKLEY